MAGRVVDEAFAAERGGEGTASRCAVGEPDGSKIHVPTNSPSPVNQEPAWVRAPSLSPT
jgi:hypothetical protein